MASREGIGDIFADGILRVAHEFGLEDLAVHVKGMEPPLSTHAVPRVWASGTP